VWSSVVDAPITYGLTECGLLCWIEQEWGREGLHWWEKKKKLVEMTGISEELYTVAGVLSNNRAGPSETELTEREIVTAYCERKSIGEWHA
jgi:hypothetical protein